ncbi:MAG: helix-turn-helix domain-containing protein [Rhodococcus sp. (in: high G+C Gram-positive bacteria)]|jgi:predicted DNA-binding transcriptional regulator AlpA
MTERFMSTKQVSEAYGIPEATLRYWRHCNAGPASFAMGGNQSKRGRVMYRQSAVDEWLAHQEATTSRGGVA